MKISVILGHPRKESFNHAIAKTVVETLRNNNYEVNFHDLYDEKFEPILPDAEIPEDASLGPMVEKHCREIAAANGIVIIHPNWWGQPPAILKGWVDRVLRPGVAYTFAEGDSGDGELIGLLKASIVLVFNTSNTPAERESTIYGDPLETLWKNNMFISCGVKSFYRKNFGIVVTSTLEQREQWLREVQEITNQNFPKNQ